MKPPPSRSAVPDRLMPNRQMGKSPQARIHPRTSFRVGTIVRAPLHEQYKQLYTPNAPSVNNYVSESAFGQVHTKCRKLIIVALYEENYIALPLYSHEGKGLDNKRNKDEHVSIKDHRSSDKFVAQSRYKPLQTGFLEQGITTYLPNTTAHLTYPISRRYDHSCVIEGNLARTSSEYLLKLYVSFTPKLPN